MEKQYFYRIYRGKEFRIFVSDSVTPTGRPIGISGSDEDALQHIVNLLNENPLPDQSSYVIPSRKKANFYEALNMCLNPDADVSKIVEDLFFRGNDKYADALKRKQTDARLQLMANKMSKVNNIYVDTTEDYPSCPLRSDVNSCKAVRGSEVNSCPASSEEDDYLSNRIPDWCPLRNGGVCVKIKEGGV
jgi:hypothetical protein